MSYYFEDVSSGQSFESASRTITNYEIMSFAGLTGDFAPAHTDDVYASKSVFGKRVAHGSLVISLAMGLLQRLELFSGTVIAPLDMTWKFGKPVLLGDTIRVRMTIQEKRETSKPDRGLLVRAIEVLNQEGDVVQSGTSALLVRRRPA
jgi:acyl dehydratase